MAKSTKAELQQLADDVRRLVSNGSVLDRFVSMLERCMDLHQQRGTDSTVVIFAAVDQSLEASYAALSALHNAFWPHQRIDPWRDDILPTPLRLRLQLMEQFVRGDSPGMPADLHKRMSIGRILGVILSNVRDDLRSLGLLSADDETDGIDWDALHKLAQKVKGRTGRGFRYITEKRLPIPLADLAILLDWSARDDTFSKFRSRVQTHIRNANLPYVLQRFDSKAQIIAAPPDKPKKIQRNRSDSIKRAQKRHRKGS